MVGQAFWGGQGPRSSQAVRLEQKGKCIQLLQVVRRGCAAGFPGWRLPLPPAGQPMWFELASQAKGGSTWVFLSICPDVGQKRKRGVMGLAGCQWSRAITELLPVLLLESRVLPAYCPGC